MHALTCVSVNLNQSNSRTVNVNNASSRSLPTGYHFGVRCDYVAVLVRFAVIRAICVCCFSLLYDANLFHFFSVAFSMFFFFNCCNDGIETK